MLTSLDPHSGYLDPDRLRRRPAGHLRPVRRPRHRGHDGGGRDQGRLADRRYARPPRPASSPTTTSSSSTASRCRASAIDDAVGKMKGPVGTKIKLTVVREGAAEAALFRAHPRHHRAARGALVDGRRRRRSSASRASPSRPIPGIQKAIKDIYDQRKGEAPKGIVLDLRNNPGGLVDQAVYVVRRLPQAGRGGADARPHRRRSRRATMPSPTTSTPRSPTCRWSC